MNTTPISVGKLIEMKRRALYHHWEWDDGVAPRNDLAEDVLLLAEELIEIKINGYTTKPREKFAAGMFAKTPPKTRKQLTTEKKARALARLTWAGKSWNQIKKLTGLGF